ncbi:hypothetical protein ACP70R_029672 [Stipagrostis hirtigluma subsp. patula]
MGGDRTTPSGAPAAAADEPHELRPRLLPIADELQPWPLARCSTQTRGA